MTPPDANIRKQKRRHWPVFWGIVGAFMLAIMAWLFLAAEVKEPEGAVTPIGTDTDAAD